MTTTTTILALVGALAGSLVTWLVARRKSQDERRTTSGDIDTTEAVKLWEEAKQMRSDMRAEIMDDRKEMVRLQSLVLEVQRACDQDLKEIRVEVSNLKQLLATALERP